jgi:MFS family permease
MAFHRDGVMGGNGGAINTRTVILANLFVNTIGWTILLPVFPEIHAFFNANTATVGSLASLVAIFTLVCGTIQGYASDYFGRLFMLQVSAISQLLGHLLTLLSLYCGSYYLYVVARCIPALLKCTMVVTQAYMYDLDNQLHSKDMKIGSMFAFSNFSFIVGPLIGGAVIARSIYLPSIAGVILSVVELYLLTLLPSVPPAPVVQDRNNGNSSGVQVPMQPSHSGQQLLFELLQVKFAYQLCNAEFEALFAQLARERLGLSARVIGRMFSLSGALNMFLNLYVLDPVLRHQPERFLGILLAVTVVGLVIWGGTNSLPW